VTITEPLPSFRYHPDPVATGSVELSDKECVCCAQARGYIYTGPVYSEADHEDDICPWCIADGSANQKLDVQFTDADGIGGYGLWDDVPTPVAEEVAYRTPGFTGWQQEKWVTCCKDAACFMGRAGYKDLLALGANAIEAIRVESDLEGDEWEAYFKGLDKDDQPTAYLFRCLHCQKLGGYSDFT
jgi:uncharacterized protein CbrC (UPF0167 family)